MARLPNEDLFEGTKMTFGEHLEELRVALFRSLIGLMLGTLIGFLVSNRVVNLIEVPLTRALEEYYLNKAETTLKAQYKDIEEGTLGFVQQRGLVFEDVYVERQELQRWLAVERAVAATLVRASRAHHRAT